MIEPINKIQCIAKRIKLNDSAFSSLDIFSETFFEDMEFIKNSNKELTAELESLVCEHISHEQVVEIYLKFYDVC